MPPEQTVPPTQRGADPDPAPARPSAAPSTASAFSTAAAAPIADPSAHSTGPDTAAEPAARSTTPASAGSDAATPVHSADPLAADAAPGSHSELPRHGPVFAAIPEPPHREQRQESQHQPSSRQDPPRHEPPRAPAELAHARRQVTNIAPVLFGAGLGVLLVVLGLPTLVLVWRSALASTLSPSGLVGGLLVLVGLVLLCAGGFSLVSGAAKVEQDAAAGRWAAVVLRPSVMLVLLGVILLVCAALAV